MGHYKYTALTKAEIENFLLHQTLWTLERGKE